MKNRYNKIYRLLKKSSLEFTPSEFMVDCFQCDKSDVNSLLKELGLILEDGEFVSLKMDDEYLTHDEYFYTEGQDIDKDNVVKIHNSTSFTSNGSLNEDQKETLSRLILACVKTCGSPALYEEITHTINYDEKEIIEKYTVEDFLETMNKLDEYETIMEEKEKTPDDFLDYSEFFEGDEESTSQEEYDVSYELSDEEVFNEEDASDIFK